MTRRTSLKQPSSRTARCGAQYDHSTFDVSRLNAELRLAFNRLAEETHHV
jgi:hypothetical protein